MRGGGNLLHKSIPPHSFAQLCKAGRIGAVATKRITQALCNPFAQLSQSWKNRSTDSKKPQKLCSAFLKS